MNTDTPSGLQCQQEARRFASSAARVDEIRKTTVSLALFHLRAGHGAQAALDVMLAGLADQCPLTFGQVGRAS